MGCLPARDLGKRDVFDSFEAPRGEWQLSPRHRPRICQNCFDETAPSTMFLRDPANSSEQGILQKLFSIRGFQRNKGSPRILPCLIQGLTNHRQLVSRESSCLDGHPHIPLDVRHAMMNKFRGPNDGNFKLVSKCVKDLSDNACIIQSRTKEEMNCLRSLTSDYRDNKDRNRKRVPGTCQWVLDHPTFIGWLEAPSGLLWIFADPGCGKSVLSRALVDERRVSRNTKVASICYFFFKDDDAARQSGAHAMSAILHQLFMQRPGLLKHAMPHFEGHGERLHTMLGTLWDILKEAADDPEAGEIVCVLDALDECKELERNQLIEKLGDLVSVPARQTAKLKFLITSRPYLDIESNVRHVVDNMSAISLRGEDESDKISQEISLVIDDRVTCISASRRPPLVKTVQDALKEELNSVPNRSYLWVYLIFDILQRSAESTETRLLKLARTIPRTIDEAYEKILRRVNESGTDEQAKRILHIIVAATRPLTLQEMKIALCIDEKLVEGESCRSFSDLDLPMDEHFREKIRQLCGLFISVIDSIMYLIHQTAKEFLIAKENSEKISRPNEARPQSWKESLQPYESNLLLAEICICYLLFFDINCQVDIDPLLLSSYGSPEYAFLAYAVAYWIDHLRRAKTKRNNNIWKAILDLFSAGSNQRWQLIYWQQAIGLSHIAHVGVTRLTALSTLGLNEAVNLLLDENGAELNALDHDGMTALSWAALKGHTETVQLLLQRDCVEINTRSKALSTPLCQAATEGHGDVVRLLLQKDGLEPDVPDLDSRTPLSWASRNGHTEVVRLLLEKDGVDLNTQDEDGLTPLCLAALAGHADTARLLLQKSGVDPNLPDDAYGLTPLLLAAEEGHAEVVRLLLQRDDVKLKSAGHLCIWTPLIQAILRGRTEVVRLLLDKEGLEPNTMYGQELLSSAARAGHPEIIALLDQAAHQAR